MKILAETPKFDFGIATGIEIAAAIITTAAQIRTISSQKFADGGMVAVGPSHAQGGIQLLHRGRPAGIEIEGGEPVLTAAVSSNPLLLGMASMINQLAGGRALTAGPMYLADGGVARNMAEILPQVRTNGIVTMAGPAVDYDLLTNMMAAKLGPAFVAGAKALPPQETNITDLRQRLKSEDKREADTNI